MSFLPIIVALILFFLNMPVALALAVATVLYFGFINTTMPVDLIIQRMVVSNESFILTAVPFFTTAGVVMNYAGISSRLMGLADALAGHLKGGLAQVNVVLNALLGGPSGSGLADAAAITKMLGPEMIKKGYSAPFTASLTASGATLGPILPPGIPLLVYAFLADVSVDAMFLGGIIPGLLMTAALMLAVGFTAKQRGWAPYRDKRASAKEVLVQTRDSLWALFLPFGLIMGLRIGLFTPTEAGAMTVLYGVVVGAFIYRELKVEHLPPIIVESVLSSAAIMLIIAVASAFGYYLSWERIPQQVTGFLVGISSHPWVFLLIVNLFLLVCGMFMEGTALLIILTPLLLPVAKQMGIDPVHFGIVIIVNMVIGGVTPPFGTMMFLTCALLKVKVVDYAREGFIFILALIAVLFLITYIPDLVTILPNLFAAK